MKNILLPVIAVSMALIGIGYSACHESKADAKEVRSANQIRSEITQFEIVLKELNSINDQRITSYGEEMGVTSSSQGLEQITKRKEILENARLRLEYHRLQLIQADTTNETRNEIQLKELAEDLAQLKINGEIIRAGIGGEVNTRVTK